MPSVPKPAPRSPAKRKPVKRKNVKRRSAEWLRAYGSIERVLWFKAQPCAACGFVGASENAHARSQSGGGRKGDANTILPLCGPHVVRPNDHDWHDDYTVEGCHVKYDRGGDLILPKPALEIAAEHDAIWQTFSGV